MKIIYKTVKPMNVRSRLLSYKPPMWPCCASYLSVCSVPATNPQMRRLRKTEITMQVAHVTLLTFKLWQSEVKRFGQEVKGQECATSDELGDNVPIKYRQEGHISYKIHCKPLKDY